MSKNFWAVGLKQVLGEGRGNLAGAVLVHVLITTAIGPSLKILGLGTLQGVVYSPVRLARIASFS